MSEVRDFDEEYGFADKEGVSFKLGGHVFTTKPVLHPYILLKRDGNEGGLETAIRIIRSSLTSEDEQIFSQLIDDPEVLISANQVDQIAAWIMEEISGRPTKQPRSSGAGEKQTGRTSKAVSPLPDRTATA